MDTTARQIVALAQVNATNHLPYMLSPNKMPVKSLLECVSAKEMNSSAMNHLMKFYRNKTCTETIGLTSVDQSEQQLAMIDTN